MKNRNRRGLTRASGSTIKRKGHAAGPLARRFTEDERTLALTMLARGLAPGHVAKAIGTSTESLRRWRYEEPGPAVESTRSRAKSQVPATTAKARTRKPKSKGTKAKEPAETKDRPADAEAALGRSIYAPKDPGSGLSDIESAAILEWKREHPSMGPAQLRAQLKRFKGWRLSLKAIARVLRQHGYETVHRGSRPKGEAPIRFEAPRRNALWQADFAEVRVHAERLHVLVIMDDFSRFVVGHALCDAPTSAIATETLKAAIARHGKPEAVRTDRGGAFVASAKEGDFARFLEAELIDPVRGRAYHPQGGGKVESVIGTLRRELWDLGEFADRHEAALRLAAFFERFNYARAHMGIDGLTPADRFFGRADQVLARIDAISRGRQGSTPGTPDGAIEEVLAQGTGAPLEILRLVLQEGVMELRFCGARVRLGRIDPIVGSS